MWDYLFDPKSQQHAGGDHIDDLFKEVIQIICENIVMENMGHVKKEIVDNILVFSGFLCFPYSLH